MDGRPDRGRDSWWRAAGWACALTRYAVAQFRAAHRCGCQSDRRLFAFSEACQKQGARTVPGGEGAGRAGLQIDESVVGPPEGAGPVFQESLVLMKSTKARRGEGR